MHVPKLLGNEFNGRSKSPADAIRIEWTVNALGGFYAVMGNGPAEDGAMAAIAEILCREGTDEQIKAALNRCMHECRYPVRLPDILQRMPGIGPQDGRPGPEEAWAMCPKDDDASVVWTDEIAEAFGVARPLLLDGDAIAARMAFKEVYPKLIEDARSKGLAVRWTVSLGYNKADQVRALSDAVQKGRLQSSRALSLLQPQEQDAFVLTLPVPERKLLRGDERDIRRRLTGLPRVLAELSDAKKVPDMEPPARVRYDREEQKAHADRVRAQAAKLREREAAS